LNNKNNIASLREEYDIATLKRADLQNNPFQQFEIWLNNAYASKVKEPNAMCISTVNENGQPSSRMVLLRGIVEQGFLFYTNYNGKKGIEIAINTKVALLFFWADLQQQVRIEGHCEKVSDKMSDNYFSSRPLKSQAASKASPQSSIIENREILEKLFENEWKHAQIKNKAVRPEHWGGYLVKPQLFEFWQGRPSRLHDRFQYVLKNTSWVINRLAP